MTHDELLLKIGSFMSLSVNELNQLVPNNPPAVALRAVVELHKPVEVEYFDNAVCFACSPDIYTYFDYPCATIQAIEKELS